MNINTQLTQQDFIHAYKEMCRFIFRHPFLMGVLLSACLLVSVLPFSLFPLKMAAFAGMISLAVCLVSLQYRTGGLDGLFTEIRLQQRLVLPAILAITTLSWLGFICAQRLVAWFAPASETLTSSALHADTEYSTWMIVVAMALVCVAQVLPYVLAHFCRTIGLNRVQGEHIWLALLLNGKTVLAFLPVAQLSALGIIFETDVSSFILLAATMYSVFLMFIVFNIEPGEHQKASEFNLVGQL